MVNGPSLGTTVIRLIPRRGRRGHSCDNCYARKIRCDNAKPKCDWCSHQNLECTYLRRSGQVESKYIDSSRESLEQGIGVPIKVTPFAEVNGRLSKSHTPPRKYSEGSADQPSIFQVPEKWYHERVSMGHDLENTVRHLGNICTFDGVHVLSARGQAWIDKCTGEQLSLEKLPRHRQSKDTRLGIPRLPLHSLNLPEPKFLHEQAQIYHDSIFGQFFPVLDPILFQETVQVAFGVKQTAISSTFSSAKACIFALLALVAIVIHNDSFSLQTSALCYEEAHRLLPAVLEEPISLNGLQAVLLLCLCAQGLTGDPHLIGYLLSVSARFIYHMKANLQTEEVHKSPSSYDYHARILFWIAYICDKGFSLVTGLAPFLPDSQCDLRPFRNSLEEAVSSSTDWNHLHDSNSSRPYMDISLRLAFIQSHIYRLLYEPNALQQRHADLLRTIRNLDSSLESWRKSIPPPYRPSFTTYLGNSEGAQDIRSSIFYLQYHHCTIMIHQTSSRCDLWKENQDTQDTASSLAISVAASRNLLGSFINSRFELSPQNILFCLSYFMQASFNIFFNILSQNFHATNDEDLRLLASIIAVIRQHQKADVPICFAAKIEFAAQVISETSRLARCSIEKAETQKSLVIRGDV